MSETTESAWLCEQRDPYSDEFGGNYVVVGTPEQAWETIRSDENEAITADQDGSEPDSAKLISEGEEGIRQLLGTGWRVTGITIVRITEEAK